MQKVSTEVLLYFIFSFLCFFAPTYAYGQVDFVCDSDATGVTTLSLDGEVTGSFEPSGGLDYYRIEVTAEINLEIATGFTARAPGSLIGVQLCDDNDNMISLDSDNGSERFLDLSIDARLGPGTYFIGIGSERNSQYELQISENDAYNNFLSLCETFTMRNINEFSGHDFNDPLYGCQWHLKNNGIVNLETGPENIESVRDEDINVEDIWLGGTVGRGINVAVIDDGMDSDHEDLADNVNTDLNHSYTSSDSIYNPADSHGTAVAGAIAAVGGNGIGGRGVASQATIYGYNFTEMSTTVTEADAMTRNLSVTAISNNSWGVGDSPALHPATGSWEMAVERGVTEGFGGKGIFYSWAAGNGDDDGDQANFEEYNNYYAVTSVCSVDNNGVKSFFSEQGVNLWVCAPGRAILTTVNGDRYSGWSGTSISTPVVSGVAALVRETNSELSWRDVKLILAASARKNDESDSGWEDGALKYGSGSERYSYNSKYGFGVVDAEAAVGLAESWSIVPSMSTLTISSGDVDERIPATGHIGNTELTLNLPESDFFIEFVEVNIMFSHTFFPELSIDLISPTGTASELVRYQREHVEDAAFNGQRSYTDYSHRFGSAKHLGENPSGQWTLRISDNVGSDTGTLHSWNIKVYGHSTELTFGTETIEDQQYVQNSAITPLNLPEATNGNGNLIYSLSPLPDGLVFDSGTRVLSGSPTTAGVTTVTYTALDADGEETTLTFRINVIENSPPPTTPPPTTPPTTPPSNPIPTPGNDTGGGGGGCTISGHSSDYSGLLGAMACLMLIPFSVAIRRKRRIYQIKNTL